MHPPNSSDPVDWAGYHFSRNGYGDPASFLAMSSILRLHRHVTSSMTEALKPFQLNPSTYMLLMTLTFVDDDALSLTSLSRALMVHPSTVTLMVDQLEARQLVVRRAHGSDRRTTMAQLTGEGRQVLQLATTELRGLSFGLGLPSAKSARALVDATRMARMFAGDAGEDAGPGAS